jgi:hypothetical protein
MLARCLHSAFLALADFPQIIPGIDAAGVTVIPGDIECISAYRLDLLGLGRFLVHGQQAGCLLGRFTGTAMVIVALFRAGGAGACVAQPLEAEVRVMAVVPLDVHSGTCSDIDFDRLGIDYGHIDKYIQAEFGISDCRNGPKVLYVQ